MVIASSANYDGVHTVDAASTVNEIEIAATYSAEPLTGAETATALVVTLV
jgi:hypothetical protein